MTSLAAVRAWPLEQLEIGTSAVEEGAESIWGATQRAQSALSGGGDWTGATHDAAGRAVGVHAARGTRMVRTLEAVSAAGRRAAGELLPMRSKLLQLVDTALAAGFTVTDDGRVTHPEPKRTTDASYLGSRIGRVLTQLGELDQKLGAQLRAHAATLAGESAVVPGPLGGVASPAVVSTQLASLSVEARRAYWDELLPAERSTLINADPQTFGNLDGIPFADRAMANEKSIRAELAKELAAGRGDGARAKELAALLRPVPGPDGTPVPRKFIAFSNEGHGHYIEQVGELRPGVPGVGVLIPGTGSNLGNSLNARRRAAELSARSGAPVFVYADGDLPQRVYPDPGRLTDRDVFRDTAFDPLQAHDLGRSLVGFGQALDAEIAAEAPGAPTTYIGHSYGGSVLGTAEQNGLRADNIVFASSAGTGVDDGPWRDRNPDVQRYSMTPPGDPIHWSQKYGGAVHGGDPDTAPGVQRLDTGHYGPDGRHHGALVQGADGHTAYLDDPGSTAFDNLTKILAGEKPAPYVDRGPDIPAQERAPEPEPATGREVLESARRAGEIVMQTPLGTLLKLPGLLIP